MKKIIVSVVITYNDGRKEIKEFLFDAFYAGKKFISDYIKDNTVDCHHVTIIDVWIEI